jgi:hypothetical protein
MMKNLKTIIALFMLTLCLDLWSQNIILDVSTGREISSAVRFKWSSTLKDNSSGSTVNGNLYSIGVSGQLYKFLYIRTEIGANSLHHLLQFDYEPSSAPSAIGSGGGKVFGWYGAEYFYWAFLPEVRFLKDGLLYANVGFASYNNISSVFNNVIGNRDISDDFRGNSNAFVANIGINPKWNNIGVMLNLGFHSINPTSRNTDYIPQIGFSQLNVKFGVSYNIK